MAKCPECGEEINYLFNVCEEICRYVFELDDNGCPRYDYDDAWQGSWDVYKCPVCGAELFTSEEDAVNFLKQNRQPFFWRMKMVVWVKCPYCDELFELEEELERHLAEEHESNAEGNNNRHNRNKAGSL